MDPINEILKLDLGSSSDPLKNPLAGIIQSETNILKMQQTQLIDNPLQQNSMCGLINPNPNPNPNPNCIPNSNSDLNSNAMTNINPFVFPSSNPFLSLNSGTFFRTQNYYNFLMGAQAIQLGITAFTGLFGQYARKNLYEQRLKQQKQINNKKFQIMKEYMLSQRQFKQKMLQNKQQTELLKLQTQKLRQQNQIKQKALNEKTAQYQQKIKKIQEQYKMDRDIKKFKQNQQNHFQIYLKSVAQQCKKITPNPNVIIVTVLGNISSGKSSLFNKLFNLNLEVGVGETTLIRQPIKYNIGNIQIWDCPGMNQQQHSIFDANTLTYYAQSSLVLILYPDSIKTVKRYCQAMFEIKPDSTILVRTKCDLRSNKDKKTIEEELAADQEALKSWNIQFKFPIFATSAVNDMKGNEELKKILEMKKF